MMKMRVLLVTLLLLVSVIFNNGLIKAECPSNFLRLYTKCYYFSSESVKWMDAYYSCKDLGSNMVILSNKHQDYRLRHYLLNGFLVSNDWWIGANYDWKQRVWKWAPSGRAVKYEQFTNKQNYTPNWSCAILDSTLDYKWNSKQCFEKKHFICQKRYEGNSTDLDTNDLPIIESPFSKSYQIHNKNLKQNESKPKTQPAFIKTRPIRTKSKYDGSRPKLFCPKGYRHVKNKCYKFSQTQETFQNAYFACDSANNGTLAIVKDRREDLALRRSAKRSGDYDMERWIGGRYDWEEMAWKWALNGVIIQHQNQDREQLRWHCLVWDPKITDKWSADNCVREKYYICQTEGTFVKFPSKFHKNPASLKDKHRNMKYSNKVQN